MKIEIDQNTIDRLIKKRVTAFNKEVRDLTTKLDRRDKKIQKLSHELEVIKGGRMNTEKETADRIAKLASILVGELQKANWIEEFECYEEHCGDDCCRFQGTFSENY